MIFLKELSFQVGHKLGAAQAKKRLCEKIEELKDEFEGKFELESDWNGYEFSFRVKAQGLKTEGILKIDDRNVFIRSTLPLIAVAFKKRIEDTLREQLKTLLE